VADRRPSVVLPGHGAVFGHVTARIEAIFRNKVRRMEAVRRMISSRAVHRQRHSDRACCEGHPTLSASIGLQRPCRISPICDGLDSSNGVLALTASTSGMRRAMRRSTRLRGRPRR